MFQIGTVVMNNEQIGTIQMHWITLRGAVKLEEKGMFRSRKPSAKRIAIKELSLAPNASYQDVITALSRKIDGPDTPIAKTEPRCPECGQLLTYGFCKCDNDFLD